MEFVFLTIEAVFLICRKIIWAILPRSFNRYIDKDSAVGVGVTLLTTIALISLIIMSTLYVMNYLAVDRCLDSGAKWNYEIGKCIFK